MLEENNKMIAPNPAILTVEQLNLQIKQILEGQIGQIWVKGEVSNFKAHTSGHYYFSLKDARSQITAVMFRGFNSKLKFRPTDGMEVLVRGRISVYEPRGNYQILCEMMEPVGAGALQKAFEQLKMKLKTEGLFDSSRKKPLPLFPQHIAVITSPTGAAIQDILNVLNRRVKNIEITIVPTVVQGADAAPLICEAFKKAQKLPGVDVVIIGRGGGSMEDLWCFNDENLARLIAASKIPVISAVGHEIDFTICDFVSDLRAPTPSAAAELVAKSSVEILQKVQNLSKLMTVGIERILKNLAQRCLQAKTRLVDPQKKLQDIMLRNDDLKNRMDFALDRLISEKRFKIQLLKQRLISPSEIIKEKSLRLNNVNGHLNHVLRTVLERKNYLLKQKMSVLDSLSPLKVVERGYSIVTQGEAIIKNVNQIQLKETILIRLAHGEIKASVEELKK